MIQTTTASINVTEVCSGTSGALALRSFGVAKEALCPEQEGSWVAIEAELDRFSAYGYGRASQRRFLHAPNTRLNGLTPAEALGQRDGVESVLQVLRRSLAGLESSAF